MRPLVNLSYEPTPSCHHTALSSPPFVYSPPSRTDAAGIVTVRDTKLSLRKGNGLVRDVFEQVRTCHTCAVVLPLYSQQEGFTHE